MKRLEYIGVSAFDQLLKYNYKQRLPQLGRVCLSSYFMETATLERFLVETLPSLEYLEISSVNLSDDLLTKCSEKFKQLVVFGSPDLPHHKRQHLLPTFTVQVSIIFARDFPLNFRSTEPDQEAPKYVSIQTGQQAIVSGNMTGGSGGPSRTMVAAELDNPGSQSMLIDDGAARILASS